MIWVRIAVGSRVSHALLAGRGLGAPRTGAGRHPRGGCADRRRRSGGNPRGLTRQCSPRQAETSPGWRTPPHPVPAVAVPGEPSAGQRRAGKARETPRRPLATYGSRWAREPGTGRVLSERV